MQLFIMDFSSKMRIPKKHPRIESWVFFSSILIIKMIFFLLHVKRS
nr:MAG TPA: hypothetical protein [Caudoviricetes sp.]